MFHGQFVTGNFRKNEGSMNLMIMLGGLVPFLDTPSHLYKRAVRLSVDRSCVSVRLSRLYDRDLLKQISRSKEPSIKHTFHHTIDYNDASLTSWAL